MEPLEQQVGRQTADAVHLTSASGGDVLQTALPGGQLMAPYTAFGQKKMVPVVVFQNNNRIDSAEWDEDLWVERAEDWYALGASSMKRKRVRVIDGAVWRGAKESV